jgi:hypothetical protein
MKLIAIVTHKHLLHQAIADESWIREGQRQVFMDGVLKDKLSGGLWFRVLREETAKGKFNQLLICVPYHGMIPCC